MQQLTRQLRQWQALEWLFRVAWGGARWFALVAFVLIACCLADWLIDRRTDTPLVLRIAMTLGQAALAGLLGYWLLFKLNVPSFDILAGRAEDAFPTFDHRLVTALQLNRPGADIRSVSPQLLEAVTREADALSSRHRLASLADTSRLEQAAMVFVPVLLLLGVFVAFRSTLTWALLQRQAFVNVPIPRSVMLEHVPMSVQAAGEPVKLQVKARGAFREDSVGRVVLDAEGQPRQTYALKFGSKLDAETAIFIAEVPSGSAPFTFKATLHDGRTHGVNRIEYAPRPWVKDFDAWLVLPNYVDAKKQTRFERRQPLGEVTALPDCGLRVALTASKPVQEAKLILLARPDGKTDVVLDAKPMTLNEDRTVAEYAIDKLPPTMTGYRLELVDEHGLVNVKPPTRGIALSTYKTPVVSLLPEMLMDPDPNNPDERGPLEDYAFDGMPVVLDGVVQIGYHARSPLGIDRVFIWYRVNPQDRDKDPWKKLAMKEVMLDLAKTGRFRPELGLFEQSGKYGIVEYFPIPANDPAAEPSGLEAGGRYSFQTRSLRKTLSDGSEAKLEVGDQVEFVVAAFDRRPGNRTPGESQSRLKAVVTETQLLDWRKAHFQSRGRLEELFAKQRRVFQSGKDKPPGKP